MKRLKVTLLTLLSALSPTRASEKYCSTDADCSLTLRKTLHSLYCVEGVCQQLTPPGGRCSSPYDCASYFFYGPLACNAKCSETSSCSTLLGEKKSMYCCRAAPPGAECRPDRPPQLTGCPIRHRCIVGEHGPACAPYKRKKWAFGPILSISGNLLINVGLNVQKKSYVLSSISVLGTDVGLFSLGILVYAAGKVLGFGSYIFGDQSMLASLGAVGLIANSVFAPMINSEVFTICDLLAIIFVLTGSSLIVINSGRIHRVFTLCELLNMYERTPTVFWFSLVVLLIVALLSFALFVEANSDWSIQSSTTRILHTNKVFFDKNGAVLKHAMVFVYVGLSAAIASFTTLFAKSFGEMVDQTLSGDNQFIYFSTYLFFILIFLCTCGQIFWLNRALKRYDALLVIPIFHVLWTVLSVTTAGIYFQDFLLFSSSQFKGFLLGLCVIFAGSVFLGFRLLGKDAPSTEKVILDVTTKLRRELE